MKKLITLSCILAVTLSATLTIEAQYNTTTTEKIEILLSKMTLKEKIGQLNQYTSRWEMTGPTPESTNEQKQMEMIKSGQVGSMLNVSGVEATRKAQQLAVENSRLGIPLIFAYDVIHGYKTMFPIPLATASSWNTKIAKQNAQVAATEASAAGLHWTFAPMVDICRDARWGRTMEGAGEDPFLGSLMAKAQIEGYQGSNLGDNNTIAACAKHFAAYGFAEAGRDYNTVEITENTLRNIILPPFKAAAEAKVATFMNSFNVIGGIPATSNNHLLRDILKGEWQFDGFVVSDWNSIGEIYHHGVAPNKKEAAYLAMQAGTDMDMEGNCYISHLEGLIKEGRIKESTLNDAVARILKIKYDLGLFDNPYKYCNPENEKLILSEKHLSIAHESAKQSIVLLKNDNQLLPLNKNSQTIGIIGALAEDKDSPLGSWRAKAIKGSAISVLEGVKNSVSNTELIQYAKGPEFITNDPSFVKELKINETDLSGIKNAVEVAKKVDVVILTLGENCFQSGEGRSQADITLKGVQKQLFDAIYEVNKNIVVVLMNGRPLVITDIAEKATAILETWHLGSESGNAISDVLFGDYNPSGKLPISFPRSVGQCPIYYNHLKTGRSKTEGNVFWSHYTDEENTPLFPFGFGLSYTTFEYSNLTLSSPTLKTNETLTISAEITNTGKYKGKETAQLYIQDLFGSIARPVKELKAFKQIELKPGESKTIAFEISEKELSFYSAKGIWEVEPGDFKLWVGTNSTEGLEERFSFQK